MINAVESGDKAMYSRLLVAHPRRAWRQRFCWLLSQEIASIGCIDEVDTGNVLRDRLHSLSFDLVIAHHSLVPDIAILPGDHSVLLVAQLDEALLRAVRKHGILAYLSENASEALLLATLDLKPGEFLIDPAFVPLALDETTHHAETLLLFDALTPRERVILALQEEGRSPLEIAGQLCIAKSTVK
jgi:DNA-binding NarL/FixJ family response regulator